ncbi:nucleobase-ascorbate transporter 4-like isoform X4 [Populus alba]|uniref:nucleobase-ascorbate transporter 4-like isoform X4 n=1 Tax=Populus alba TaxID=43335 RepID=UPI003CC7340E
MGVPLLCLLLYSAVVLDGCENAGLLGLTRVGSQRVVQISAGFMLFFSVKIQDCSCFPYHCQLWQLFTVSSLPMRFNDIMQVIFSSPATVAILVACFLDCTHSLLHITTR